MRVGGFEPPSLPRRTCFHKTSAYHLANSVNYSLLQTPLIRYRFLPTLLYLPYHLPLSESPAIKVDKISIIYDFIP